MWQRSSCDTTLAGGCVKPAWAVCCQHIWETHNIDENYIYSVFFSSPSSCSCMDPSHFQQNKLTQSLVNLNEPWTKASNPSTHLCSDSCSDTWLVGLVTICSSWASLRCLTGVHLSWSQTRRCLNKGPSSRRPVSNLGADPSWWQSQPVQLHFLKHRCIKMINTS